MSRIMETNPIDLIGQKFGKLTVIKYIEPNRYLCKCDCGNEKIVYKNSLIKGLTRSCGCILKNNKKDMIGKRFGRLVVISEYGRDKQNQITYLCKCDCGNNNIVRGYKLRQRNVCRCGKCYEHWRPEDIKILNMWYTLKKKHNKKEIILCDEWFTNGKSFEKWVKETRKKDSKCIRTKDGTKNYNPENCYWLTFAENYNETRAKQLVTFEDKDYNFKELERKLNISHITLHNRFNKGVRGKDLLRDRRASKVYQYDLNYNLMKEYNSIKEACQEVQVTRDCLSKAIHNNLKCKGCYWTNHIL